MSAPNDSGQSYLNDELRYFQPVPYISIPLTLALVHFHPEPLDDCPCFEDAIAILSVILGSFLGHWNSARLRYAVAPDLWLHGPDFGIAIGCARIVIGMFVTTFVREFTTVLMRHDRYRNHLRLEINSQDDVT